MDMHHIQNRLKLAFVGASGGIVVAAAFATTKDYGFAATAGSVVTGALLGSSVLQIPYCPEGAPAWDR
jgi:hypothetical protein